MSLSYKSLGIDTAHEHAIYMHANCHVCRAEGFTAQARLEVQAHGRSLIATLNLVDESLLGVGELSLSLAAERALQLRSGDPVTVSHVPVLRSVSHLRAKILGQRLEREAMQEIIRDTVSGRLSDLHLAAFVTACAGDRMDLGEIIALTESMVAVGERLSWPYDIVVDKHCVGGLPGNRTTPLVVAIATACGLVMPKTSSRAITSPAGTADTMEVLTNVDLDLAAMRRVVDRTGGCLAWGGAMQLSPADDVLIRVERPLDLDSDGQLIASILSKKIAAGSNRLLIDVPVGPTAKVRSQQAAESLAGRLVHVGSLLGVAVHPLITDGAQPVGCGIGPALEARDVMQVLRNEADAPADLRERALLLAGQLLEIGGKAPAGEGGALARDVLADGRAWRQFLAICEAQGGLREIPVARFRQVVTADRAGVVSGMDNRVLARVAKLAGAPGSAVAGVDLHVHLGDRVAVGQPLFTIHAGAAGELRYAVSFLAARALPVVVEAC